ncbi:MAG: hypothetical protein JRJ09_12635 [Deltaproteobacteria bacterium]|nr:hypothetical protein [Deltaproteobacteria bacterium]
MERIVLVGAGSAMFTRGLMRDLIEHKCRAALSLVDVSEEALKLAEGLCKKMIEASGAPIQLTATVDRRAALKGASVVICTIGVGGRRAWEQDVFIPRKYGIYQPVGDSVMPGGTARSLRMIPAMVDIATDVLDLAPDAVFFNYGNPMGPVCRAVRKATGAEMVGLCHGVNQVGVYLAGMLGVDVGSLNYTATGMNHLTWFTRVSVNGKDAMPELRAIAKRQLERLDESEYIGVLFKEDGSVADDETLQKEVYPFAWQLFQLFGAFPAAMDRHVCEFFPQLFASGEYYGKKLGVDAYSFENCIACGDKIYREMEELALSSVPLPEDFFESIVGEHEQVVEMIASIRNDTGQVYSANLRNTGQVPNLPCDAIIESPAVADSRGFTAIRQEPLSSGIAGTLATRMQWVETVVEAALEGSREKFIQALIIDGAVDSIDTATRLADELLQAQAEYLPQFPSLERQLKP